jgi:hypothetical protein
MLFILGIVAACISFIGICFVVVFDCFFCQWFANALLCFAHHTFGLSCLYLILLCTWHGIMFLFDLTYLLLFHTLRIVAWHVPYLACCFAVNLWNIKKFKNLRKHKMQECKIRILLYFPQAFRKRYSAHYWPTSIMGSVLTTANGSPGISHMTAVCIFSTHNNYSLSGILH